MEVKFLDLNALHAPISDELEAVVTAVVRSGRYLLGEHVRQFEEAFASYCGVRHCVSVGNGLDALKLCLLAKGVGPGDEVIVPGHTFIATWLAVTQLGATVVPVHGATQPFGIDLDEIRGKINSRTRAVIPVDLYGIPLNLEGLASLCEENGLLLLEDAAQAHGARVCGEPVGGAGDAAAFSFYPGKNLGALGDAGALVTNDAELADRVRKLANYGSGEKYNHEFAGMNSRMDEVQAAALRVKLRHLHNWNHRRRELAAIYNDTLENEFIDWIRPSPEVEPVWHLFVVEISQRDSVAAELMRSGIETGIHYPAPPHEQACYRNLKLDFPGKNTTSSYCQRVLSLPIDPTMSDAQCSYVAKTLTALMRNREGRRSRSVE